MNGLFLEDRCSARPALDAPAYGRLAEAGRILQSLPADDLSPGATDHLRGIWNLVWHDSPGSVERAVVSLKEALARHPDDAAILSDLSVVYYLRGQKAEAPDDLVRALHYADRALSARAGLAAAAFNRALFLETLHLFEAARQAWTRFLEIDGVSGWAGEARGRLSRLNVRARRLEAAPGTASPRRRLDEFLEDVLGPWAGSSATPRNAALRDIRRQARALAAQFGDALAHDVVAALTAAEGPRFEVHRAAIGAYGDARQLDRTGRRDAAAAKMAQAVGPLEAAGSPLHLMASLQLAVLDYRRGNYGVARRSVDSLLASDLEPYPLIAGRALWIRGLIEYVTGFPFEAVESYRAALGLYRAAGDADAQAAIENFLSEAYQYMGAPDEGWKHRYRALRLAADLGTVERVYNTFDEAAESARELGFPAVASYFLDEVVRCARQLNSPARRAWALRQRAALLLTLDRREEARSDLEEAFKIVPGLGDPGLRQRLEADLHLMAARLHTSEDPPRALEASGRALGYYLKTGLRLEVVQALTTRAAVSRALGRPGDSRSDLARAISEIELQRRQLDDEDLRARFFEVSRPVYDQRLRLELEEGALERAFEIAESSRAGVVTDRWIAERDADGPDPLLRSRLSARAVGDRLAEGTALLQYHLLDDRAVAFVIRRGSFETVELPVTAAAIRTAVEDLVEHTRSIASGRPERTLVRLFEALVRPVEPRLEGAADLVVVPHGEIHRVPFAALLDRDTGRYLVEKHSIVVAPSARVHLLCRARDAALPRTGGILAVGDPALPAGVLPHLAPLPAARLEVRSVARFYAARTVLIGPEATRRRFLELSPEHEVIHFAGHALLRADLPERSALVVAGEGGGPDSGILYARNLSDVRFDRTRLFVLSACETGRAGRPSSEGGSEFSRFLLAAGVPALVATLWKIDDAPTVELMESFHRAYSESHDPVASLRIAQTEMLKKPADAGGSPLAWGAFQVLGGVSAPHPKPH